MTETWENRVTHQNSQNAKDQRGCWDAGHSGWALHRGGRQSIWRWQRNCLVNKCLLGLQKLGLWGDSDLGRLWSWDLAKFPPPHRASPHSLENSVVLVLSWEQALYWNSYRQMRGNNKKNSPNLLLLQNNRPKGW